MSSQAELNVLLYVAKSLGKLNLRLMEDCRVSPVASPPKESKNRAKVAKKSALSGSSVPAKTPKQQKKPQKLVTVAPAKTSVVVVTKKEQIRRKAGSEGAPAVTTRAKKTPAGKKEQARRDVESTKARLASEARAEKAAELERQKVLSDAQKVLREEIARLARETAQAEQKKAEKALEDARIEQARRDSEAEKARAQAELAYAELEHVQIDESALATLGPRQFIEEKVAILR